MFQRGGDKKSKRMDLARTSEALQAKYPIAMIFLVKVRFGPRFQGCPLGNKSGHPLEMKRFNNRRKYDSESSSIHIAADRGEALSRARFASLR
ncbi:uncharacterized protein PITG_17152 [Phytophthora infestans T30-4]|uniref:Uncharacterized protein n=1 Tax=Phytophthora infestans (strain T30-4) TaxID=403677 RepID=D0NV54_PHYIT|nr:uncharacterized protein PITG_17152 [Phytophthora infestans T30-4]EEY66526.1 hypothetical protein PITG_17152 [Phytophthora infestans T30-4]|eukprot:XP_002897045.1 hypothetical protein PITG_17152 [Phytophthora infestans T30-4]